MTQIELPQEPEANDYHSDAGSISIASTHSICSSPFSSASLQTADHDLCLSTSDHPVTSNMSMMITMEEKECISVKEKSGPAPNTLAKTGRVEDSKSTEKSTPKTDTVVLMPIKNDVAVRPAAGPSSTTTASIQITTDNAAEHKDKDMVSTPSIPQSSALSATAETLCQSAPQSGVGTASQSAQSQNVSSAASKSASVDADITGNKTGADLTFVPKPVRFTISSKNPVPTPLNLQTNLVCHLTISVYVQLSILPSCLCTM